MSKILVTGGAGYIGSQTNLHLLEQGFDTIVLDNLVYGHKEVVPVSSEFIHADLMDMMSLEKVFSAYDISCVIHFAAYAYVGESVVNPEKYYYNNVVGTLNLLQCMKKYEVKNIVFSSTCATYGMPKKVPITELEIQSPINPYGRSKLMVEQILEDYSRAYSLNTVYLRYFNAAGSDTQNRTGEWHEPETHLIPLILDVAAGKKDSITIFGNDYDTPDGTCIRDYIHTEDLAEAHILAVKKLLEKDGICQAVNLGTGHGYSVLEIVKAAEQVTGKHIPYTVQERRPGDPAILIADNTKAKDYLGWQPQRSSIEHILSTAWKWYCKQNEIEV
jgi:UDP-glucose 4-epimerase